MGEGEVVVTPQGNGSQSLCALLGRDFLNRRISNSLQSFQAKFFQIGTFVDDVTKGGVVDPITALQIKAS